jgi:hypothetical protein
MKLNAYSIYDTASGTYMRPFFTTADGQAIRSFSDISTDATHEVGKHPEDYSLHRIGIFDDNKGTFTPENPECIATGLEMVSASRDVNRDRMDQLNMNISPGGTD